MKPKVTWIVLADGASAKVFENTGAGSGLTAIPDLMFEEAPLKAQDIMADKQGRVFASAGQGRSGYEYPTDPVKHREANFVKNFAETLNRKHAEGAFSRLVLAAAPTALGGIRPHLSKDLQQAIIAEIPKDLTNQPTAKLASHFDGILVL